MRGLRAISVVIGLGLVVSILSAQPQKRRLQTEYLKDINRTMVSANTLYVYNSPQQFVQLQLRGIVWGTEPLFPAEEVRLEFYSFTDGGRFKKRESQKIELVADGRTINMDRLEYKTLTGDKALQMLPRVAQVNGKLVLETLIARVTAEFVQMLMEANAVEFRLGDAKFTLNDDHRDILKEFGAFVLPKGDINPTPGNGVELIAPVAPVELNGAPLATVLKWLHDKLQATATAAHFGRITRFEAVDFSSCQIRYRTVSEVMAINSSVDLSKLNPALIKAVSYDDRAYVYLRTRNGGWGSSLKLASPKHAPAVTAALRQAVTLCQPTP